MTHNFIKRFIAELNFIETKQASNAAAGRIPIPHVGVLSHVRAAMGVGQNDRWVLPAQGVIKIKVDAATSMASMKGAVAAVGRDHIGRFLGSSSLVLLGVLDPKILETIAIREGQCLADDLYQRRVIISSYCKTVVFEVKTVQGGIICRS